MFDLRTVLRLDAAASGGLGVLLLALNNRTDDLLGLPGTFSVVTGAALIAWAAFVAWVSVAVDRSWVKEVVALNVIYVLASVALAVSDWLPLTALGVAFVLLQAGAVLVLSIAQLGGLRRTGAAVTA